MSTPTSPSAAFAEMDQLIRGFQLSRMIQVAVALGLPDQLTDGPEFAAPLALKVGADPQMLLRLCRALAAFGIFEIDADDRIGQSVRSDTLRKNAVPTLYHAARYWAAPHVTGGWANLEHAVRTGDCAFEAVYHMPVFDYLKLHPDEAELFNVLMQNGTGDRPAAVAAACDLTGASLVVDVGGGTGALLAALLERNPGMRGLLFDQEAVVAGAGRVLGELAKRVEVQAGSFFESVPPGGDVYLLSQILHDWDDEHCLSILANIRAAMGPQKRLLVIDQVMGESGPPSPMTYLTDITMMVNLHGWERTRGEFIALFNNSGFGEPQLHQTNSSFWVLETRSI
ncbi:methyltransferase [Deinococcus detaillensis]|uniref:Methyltransferase n=1 Tax=Deinococcus detaillensis TaxID=2592048 RepID=A0A553UNC8_9DEIO|nr:methyltransferase [Deinococcus detaillensis]TSA81707.1 methyltransferase [Deinococcus detaillensis]